MNPLPDDALAKPTAPDALGRTPDHGEQLGCSCRKHPDEVRLVSSDELLQGQRELRIIHGQVVYRLLCTRNNKLILQK